MVSMCQRFVSGKPCTKQDINAHMKRHKEWGHLDSLDSYPHPKEIEDNENGSKDDDVADEDITDEDVTAEDFDVGARKRSIDFDDSTYLSDGEIEIDDEVAW